MAITSNVEPWSSVDVVMSSVVMSSDDTETDGMADVVPAVDGAVSRQVVICVPARCRGGGGR